MIFSFFFKIIHNFYTQISWVFNLLFGIFYFIGGLIFNFKMFEIIFKFLLSSYEFFKKKIQSLNLCNLKFISTKQNDAQTKNLFQSINVKMDMEMENGYAQCARNYLIQKSNFIF